MVYTPDVPQAGQRISFTQPVIESNFQFLDTGIGTEHNFNEAGTGTDMYHKQASMPNRSGGDPALPPAGTNGIYYVNGSNARFVTGSGVLCRLTEGSTSGYQWLARVLLQWGWVAGTNDDSSSTLFPLAFPQNVFSITGACTTGLTFPNSSSSVTFIRNPTVTPTNPSVTSFAWSLNGSSQINGFWWMAIGN